MCPGGAGHRQKPGNESRRSGRLHFFLSLVLLNAALSGRPASAVDDPVPRTIRIKFAVDEGLRFEGFNKGRLKELIRMVNSRLDPGLGLRFELGATSSWDLESSSGPLSVFLNNLRRHVVRDDCEVVVGLLAFQRAGRRGSGLADYFRGYIAVSLVASLNDVAAVLLHELCHVFGAPDLAIKGSVMNSAAPGRRFDALTREIVVLHRQRGFGPGILPCPPGNADEVLAILERNAPLLSIPFRYHYMRASLYFAAGNHDRALEACREALRTEPRSAEVLNLIGSVHYDKGEAGPAIRAYKQALEEEPLSPETRYNLGLAFIQAGSPEEAKSEFEEAVSLDPRYGEAWANLGWLYLGRGDIDRSIAMCRKALESDKGLIEGACTLAAALILKHEHGQKDPADSAAVDEAVGLCRQAAELKPDLALIYNLLGMALFLKGNFREAETALLKSLELEPGYLEARFNLSCLYFESGSTAKAAQHLTKVIEGAPDSILGTNILARLLGKDNRDVLFLTLGRGKRLGVR